MLLQAFTLRKTKVLDVLEGAGTVEREFLLTFGLGVKLVAESSPAAHNNHTVVWKDMVRCIPPISSQRSRKLLPIVSATGPNGAHHVATIVPSSSLQQTPICAEWARRAPGVWEDIQWTHGVRGEIELHWVGGAVHLECQVAWIASAVTVGELDLWRTEVCSVKDDDLVSVSQSCVHCNDSTVGYDDLPWIGWCGSCATWPEKQTHQCHCYYVHSHSCRSDAGHRVISRLSSTTWACGWSATGNFTTAADLKSNQYFWVGNVTSSNLFEAPRKPLATNTLG